MYEGWLSFGGTELVNSARLVAYRDSLAPTLQLLNCNPCALLQEAIEDPLVYSNPAADEAPWYDLDTIGSDEFLGFLPTSMTGFGDSTRGAVVSEALTDGGTIGRVRRGTREMRVSGMLLGATELGAEVGLTWMKAALDGGNCTNCEDGDDVCFFVACPQIGQDPDQLIRHVRKVTTVAGPTVLSRRLLSCGAYMIEIEWTWTSATPYVYGEPLLVATAEGTTLTAHLAGSEVYSLTKPLPTCNVVTSGAPKVVVLQDPDCPPIPNPPTVPAPADACKPLSFNGYWYASTQKYVSLAYNLGYQARPVVATNGTRWVSVWSSNNVSGITASSILKSKTSTDFGTTWSSSFTAYDEGSGTRGLEPAGLIWVPSQSKFVMGVNNWNTSGTGFDRWRGEILMSATGLSGSWSVVSNLDSVMAAAGVLYYRLSDVLHVDNGTTNGILYAAAFGSLNAAENTVVLLARSLDFGVTWTIMNVPHPRFTPYGYAYPQMAVWPDGEIFLSTNTSNQQVMFQRTRDGGSTWTYPRTIATKASGLPAPVIANDGSVRVLYRDMTYPGTTGLGRHNFKFSTDRGQTWTSGFNFAHWSGAGQAGADWAVHTNGDLGIVYSNASSSTRSDVWWTRFVQVESYYSYAMLIPDSATKAWQDGVLNLQIKTGPKAARQIRVMLIPRPIEGQLPEDVDPCSACGAFIIDYAPANSIVYIDGMTERVVMRVGNGNPQPADHLVSGVDGGLFSWPLLTCGMGYFLVVDADVSSLGGLALAVANRE